MRRSALAFVLGAACVLASASGFGGEGKEGWDPSALAPAGEARPAGEFRAIREILGGKLLFNVAVAIAAGSVGFMLLAAGLLPAQVARAEGALRRGPWKVVLIGIVGVAILMAAAAVLGKAAKAGAPPLGIAALAVLCLLVWLGSIGLAATAKIVGQELLRGPAGEQSAWRTVGAGALAIGAAALVPIFGTLLFVFFLCRGVGAATLAIFSPSAGGEGAQGT